MKREDFVTLPQLLRSFLTYLEVVRNKSSLTVLEYASDLRTFLRYMKITHKLVDKSVQFDEIDISDIDAKFLDEITLNDGYEFLLYCKNERNNDATARARKVTSLKSFFKYLDTREKVIKENPFRELEAPKLKKTLPKYLSLEQSRVLLNCVYNDSNPNKERDFCILTLFLNCGLRLAELVGLDLRHIHDDNSMTVTGKGNKERIVYLNSACITALNNYLKVRPVDGVKDREALFISRNKQRISRRTVQNIVENALQKSGLADLGFSTHKLRHTAATLMYRYGDVDVLLLKEILGHENLSTTQIYTHVADDQLRNAVNLNPLNTAVTDDED
ncbi:MAG: tyrosine recombinase XerC [Ruminococcaceae bacterium]|nr:tyrosine recombinase XerC [Oscillospiraceae bacterium]